MYSGGVMYPLLTYKNITYLPLTKAVCDRLWLSIGFDAQEGFYIVSTDYVPYIEDDKSVFGDVATNVYGAVYSAVIPAYPIYLNGVRVCQEGAEYPFLNFRGITYLPLTYAYAVEKLNFTLSWGVSGLKVYRADSTGQIDKMTDTIYSIELGKNVYDGVFLRKYTTGYTEYTDNFNQSHRYPYTWYDTYFMQTETGTLSHLEHSLDFKSTVFIDDDYPKARPSCDEKLSILENCVYYDSIKIITPASGEEHIGSVYGYEYKMGDKSLIYVWTNINGMRTKRYLFLKTADGIQNFTDFPQFAGLLDIFPDSLGGAYVCTASYSPDGMQRWTTPYAAVYYVDSTGFMTNLTYTIPNINSMRAFGFYEDKLYIKAMGYENEMSILASYYPFNTVNSGFFVLDAHQNHAAKKLYPYVEGETFVAQDGNAYCLTTHGQKPEIINLHTGTITIIP